MLHASYCEIYNEEIRDLLGKDVKAKLDLHEHPEKGVYVNGKVFSSENYINDVFCKTLFKVQSAGFKESEKKHLYFLRLCFRVKVGGFKE